ncbi:hypothetical protein Q5530_10170 [Saccharothrix sp. BKS2]|uniref:hypothetical protein n=1 Tax=Saccharothrix sp. BKS2 TaxID=3064400 RepID=UPI0039ED43B1
MQRPTTSGRRHNRAGSVSVAELIRQQPAPLRIRSGDRGRTAAHELVRDLLADPPARRPPNRVAKLVGVTTGVVVLLATVAAATVLAGHRDAGPERPFVEAPPQISGPPALRPDLLSAELGGSRADLLAVDRPTAPQAVEVPTGDAVVMPAAPRPGPRPRVDVVRRFYELLPARPAEALRLLAPELLGEDAREFVAAWDRVQAITIESTTLQPGGAVLAVVSMQERTGGWMRVEQLFRLSDTTVPLIVGTEVLSAQRN